MSRRLTFLLLFMTLLQADHSIIQNDEERLSIEMTPYPLGTSGIIIHKVNDDYETILARVEVSGHEDNQTQLQILPFKDLDQEALPTLTAKPSASDSVRLEWMHDRILLIAPDRDSYRELKNTQETKIFVNPDLLAVALSKEGHPSPLKEDIQAFCRAYDIGLIEFAVAETLFKVDAHSFKVLERVAIDLPKPKEIRIPFFNNIEKIHADLWGEGSDTIEDYEAYYLSLLGEKND